ncbi:MAG TPA: toll/interleukin-1 receptor domain-containing protein [Chitinophagales bacterium]|nr:toll/interleukin-1 receptor domain-containing protein [Chitinophagales bacterium]
MSQKLNIFVSYAEEDEAFKKALDRHTASLRRNTNKIAKWESSPQKAGVEIDTAITQLQNAHLIIILASANYLGNDDLWNGELRQAMQRHQKGTARIIPIAVKSFDKSGVPFGTIQGLPRKGVVASPANDEVWAAVVKEIIGVVDELLAEDVGVDSAVTAANIEKNTPPNVTHNETSVTGDGNIVIQGGNNNTFNINSNPQNQQVKDNKPPQFQQAINLVIRQEFLQAFDLLDTLDLQNPMYYQFKNEYTSGFYRNDFHYADRLITFLKSLG